MVDARMIKKTVAGFGADLCGIALGESFKGAPGGVPPKDIYEDAKSVIVFARRLPSYPLKAKTRVPYTFITEMILNELYRITYALTCRLEDEGMTAIPIPSWSLRRKPPAKTTISRPGCLLLNSAIWKTRLPAPVIRPLATIY